MSEQKKTHIDFDANIDGKDVRLTVRRPNLEAQREGQKVYNRAFSDAIESGALLRAKLDDFLREQNLWDDKKAQRLAELTRDLLDNEKVLERGGVDLLEARKLAIRNIELRREINDMFLKKQELDTNTAEGQADNARFNYWVSVCLVYNDTQKPVFSSVDDYIQNNTQDYAVEAASKLALLIYDLKEDYESTYTEQKFLKEYGFVDEKGRLTNLDGELVDEEMRRINKDGHLVNEDGHRIDGEGNLLDDEGNYEFERKPFTLDGKPYEKKKQETLNTDNPEKDSEEKVES